MSRRKAGKKNKPSRNRIIGVIIVLLAAAVVFGGNNDKNNEKPQKSKTETVEAGKEQEIDSIDSAKGSNISSNASGTIQYKNVSYKIIEVDGGDLSGIRQANAAVDIGYGDRIYWAFTNEYGQLVYVTAKEIILQDELTENVTSAGRYFNEEAKVPGTEREDLDQGHVVADSLGGVSNAYNITPQDSTLNRHGNQAYMERGIREAGGCENFVAVITYPDTTTQIPSHYHYEYILKGEVVVDDFDNINPDEENADIQQTEITDDSDDRAMQEEQNKDISSVDLDGNGRVTIAEAKAAGYSMLIYDDHWLYQYMDDRDGDGMVGE
jgi:hypothetical protein